MTKKEWFNRGRDADKVIEALEAEIPFNDNDEFQKLLEEKKQRLYEIKEEIYQVIDKLPEDKYFLILFERYIAMKTWEQIADDNHYSERHVTRLHGEALKRVKLKNNIKTDV